MNLLNRSGTKAHPWKIPLVDTVKTEHIFLSHFLDSSSVSHSLLTSPPAEPQLLAASHCLLDSQLLLASPLTQPQLFLSLPPPFGLHPCPASSLPWPPTSSTSNSSLASHPLSASSLTQPQLFLSLPPSFGLLEWSPQDSRFPLIGTSRQNPKLSIQSSLSFGALDIWL